MSSSDSYPHLELRLRPESTSSKATGTELSMEDIGHLEELQREIRLLRAEVALLEAKLRLRDCGAAGGALELQKLCGGNPTLENVPPVLCSKPVRRALDTPGGGAGGGLFKKEGAELSHCVYRVTALNCYPHPDSAHPQEEEPQEEEEGPARPLDHRPPDTDHTLAQRLEAEPPVVKCESVSPDREDQESSARNIKDEEEVSSSDELLQTPVEERSGAPVCEESISSSGSYLRTPPLLSDGPPLLSDGPPETEAYSCFWCGRGFLSAAVLRAHLSAHAEQEPEPEPLRRLYPCI